MYLAIQTDNPQAELYLLNELGEVQSQKVWQADRTLARDLPGEIDELVDNNYEQLSGIVVYKGPGSFTGLRIGITVANAIAYGQSLPIVAVAGDNWLTDGINQLKDGADDRIALPEYGATPHITPPRK